MANELVRGMMALVTGEDLLAVHAPVALTATAGVLALDLAAASTFSYLTDENATLAAPTGATPGQEFRLFVTQGSTPRTLGYASGYHWAGGAVGALTARAGAKDLIYGVVVAAGEVWLAMANDFSEGP